MSTFLSRFFSFLVLASFICFSVRSSGAKRPFLNCLRSFFSRFRRSFFLDDDDFVDLVDDDSFFSSLASSGFFSSSSWLWWWWLWWLSWFWWWCPFVVTTVDVVSFLAESDDEIVFDFNAFSIALLPFVVGVDVAVCCANVGGSCGPYSSRADFAGLGPVSSDFMIYLRGQHIY